MDYDALLDTTRDAIGIIENVLDLECKLNQLGVFEPKPFEREVKRVFDLLHRYNVDEFNKTRRVRVRVCERTFYLCAHAVISLITMFVVLKY